MGNKYERSLSTFFCANEEVRRNWGWFFALGIFMALMGGLVITSACTATIFSVVFLGMCLAAAGLVQVVQAFMACKWSGLFLTLFLGILYVVVGAVTIIKPAQAAVGLTLLIGAFCFTAGLFRMLTSLFMRFEHWGWVFFNGLVTFFLGLLILNEWPYSGLWIIGLFVGIDIFLAGWSWIVLSLEARKA